MAPEVIAQKQYDASADIWSLGITALELCNGRAPYSRDAPARVLQKILHNDPPILDRKAGKHEYSKAFKEIIESCLVKDPSKRPTAAQLLATPFFQGAKKKQYLISSLLGQFEALLFWYLLLIPPTAGLPPLVDRQERRKQATIASLPSGDSWDFSTTLYRPPSVSPTQSVHSLSPTRAHARQASLPPMNVFEMEGDDDEPAPDTGPLASAAGSSTNVNIDKSTTTIERQGSTKPIPVSSASSEKQSELAIVTPASSSSSSSNPLGPDTPPQLIMSSSAGAQSTSGIGGSSNNIWKKLTGRAKDGEGKPKGTRHGSSSILSALKDQTIRRK
jgi:serine/threonine-protein kinase OSR1/STK39